MRTTHHHGRTAALAVALTACLALVGGLAASSVAASQAPRASASTKKPDAGAAAAGWLGRQFKADGDLPAFEGTAGLDYVPLALVALASAHVGATEIKRGIGYLERHFESYVEVSSVTDPGRLAQVILAAVAARANPRRFGGSTAADDLVARLLGTQITSGADKGLFGSPAAPTYSTAYTQGLVLVALAAVGKRNALGASWLAAQQCRGGGWELYRSVSKACPPPDPKTFTGPDTNDTALAIEGLVASKVAPKVSPLGFLRGSQYSGGGFAYYGGHSTTQAPDPDSTALVAQALVALGKLSAVTRGGKGAEAGLAAFQLGCGTGAAKRGAYRYPGVSGANLYATIQAIPAAMRRAYPILPGSESASLPVMSCH